jgi:branched-chain amino acid transport system substrate-binding protein
MRVESASATRASSPRRSGLTAVGLAAIAQAQTPGPLKIAVMDGFSGVYGDLTAGEVEAMQMAIEDVGGKVNGRSVEILSADHQTKPDYRRRDRAQVVRRRRRQDDHRPRHLRRWRWRCARSPGEGPDRHQHRRRLGRPLPARPARRPARTGSTTPTALAHVTGEALVKAGGDSWFFLTADYAFGHALERDVSEVVKAAGGKVLGAVRHPLSTQDFSSFLLQAQASKAKVIGLANAGQDTINSIKQAGEFGIVKGGQKLAGLLVFATDVQSLTCRWRRAWC